jgi:hypothetical protein
MPAAAAGASRRGDSLGLLGSKVRARCRELFAINGLDGMAARQAFQGVAGQ